MTPDQHWHVTDSLQNRVAQLEGRMDALCVQMNEFIAGTTKNIVTLLQQSGAQITKDNDGQTN
jgi:hypothetical protein